MTIAPRRTKSACQRVASRAGRMASRTAVTAAASAAAATKSRPSIIAVGTNLINLLLGRRLSHAANRHRPHPTRHCRFRLRHRHHRRRRHRHHRRRHRHCSSCSSNPPTGTPPPQPNAAFSRPCMHTPCTACVNVRPTRSRRHQARQFRRRFRPMRGIGRLNYGQESQTNHHHHHSIGQRRLMRLWASPPCGALHAAQRTAPNPSS